MIGMDWKNILENRKGKYRGKKGKLGNITRTFNIQHIAVPEKKGRNDNKNNLS